MATAAVTCEYAMNATVKEIIGSTPGATDSGATVTSTQFNRAATLNSSSTPAVSKAAVFSQALASGTATLDLTALTGANGASVTGLGLKVQVFLATNPATNAATYKIDVGASNGYALSGAGWEVTLNPGQSTMLFLNEASPDIATNAKNLDLTGSGTEAANFVIVMG